MTAPLWPDLDAIRRLVKESATGGPVSPRSSARLEALLDACAAVRRTRYGVEEFGAMWAVVDRWRDGQVLVVFPDSERAMSEARDLNDDNAATVAEAGGL